MTAKKINLPPPPYFTVADLAHEWGCSPARVATYIREEMLHSTTMDLLTGAATVVGAAEKKRFECLENKTWAKAKVDINPKERESYLKVIAAVVVDTWGIGAFKEPYQTAKTIEESAGRFGIAASDRMIADKLIQARAFIPKQ